MELTEEYLASFNGGYIVFQAGPGCWIYYGHIQEVIVTDDNLNVRFSWLKEARNADMGSAPPEKWWWVEFSLEHLEDAFAQLFDQQGLKDLVSHELGVDGFIHLNHAFSGDDLILIPPGADELDSVGVKELLGRRYMYRLSPR